jgi:MFS family permease
MSFMAHEAAGLSPAAIELARRRTRIALFTSTALGSTGHIAASTVASIVGQELLGSAALSGAPGATVVFGAAMGAVALSWVMSRRGRRVGLASGYVLALLGAVTAGTAVVSRSFPLLLLGTFMIGFGNSSTNLSRYAAADLVPPNRRAVAIGLVVWGSTVGGLVGPTLVPLAGAIAPSLGLPTLAGPYLIPILFVSLAAVVSFVFLRPDPFAIAHESTIHRPGEDGHPPAVSVREVFSQPAVVAAMAALIAGQGTMVLIMTMTPLHLTAHNHGLGTVGLVISGHVAGMYALAPISGRITQRFGALPTIFLGTGVLVAAGLLAALAPPESDTLLFVALFLLGWGWNLGFVAGSALLTASVSLAQRTRVQGIADAVIWTTSAAASLGSGAVVAAAGFSTLGFLGVALVLAPVWLLLNRRSAIAAAAGTP